MTLSTGTKYTIRTDPIPPRYPPNLKFRWRVRFMIDDAWWTVRHLHEYRIVHKSRVKP